MSEEKKSLLIITDYYDNLNHGDKSKFVAKLTPLLELSQNSIVNKIKGKATFRKIEIDKIISVINDETNNK